MVQGEANGPSKNLCYGFYKLPTVGHPARGVALAREPSMSEIQYVEWFVENQMFDNVFEKESWLIEYAGSAILTMPNS